AQPVCKPRLVLLGVEIVIGVEKRDAVDVIGNLVARLDDAEHKPAAAAVTAERYLRIGAAILFAPIVDEFRDNLVGVLVARAPTGPAHPLGLGADRHEPLIRRYRPQ